MGVLMEAVICVVFCVFIFLWWRKREIQKEIDAENRQAEEERKELNSNLAKFKTIIDSYFKGKLTDNEFGKLLDSWKLDPNFTHSVLAYKIVIACQKRKSSQDKTDEFITDAMAAMVVLNESKKSLDILVKAAPSLEWAGLVLTECNILLMFEPITLYFASHLGNYPANVQILASLNYEMTELIRVLEFLFEKEITKDMFYKHLNNKSKVFAEKENAVTMPDFTFL